MLSDTACPPPTSLSSLSSYFLASLLLFPSFRHHINASLQLSSGHFKMTSLSATADCCVLCGSSGWMTRGGAKDNILKPFTERGTMSGNFHRLISTYNHIIMNTLWLLRVEITLTWFLGNIQWLAEVVYAHKHISCVIFLRVIRPSWLKSNNTGQQYSCMSCV